MKILAWVLSSVVEHLTADQEVIGSNPIVPLIFFKKYKITDLKVIHYFIVLIFYISDLNYNLQIKRKMKLYFVLICY